MRQVATIVVAVAVLAVPQAAAKSGAPSQILGFVGSGNGVSFVKLDALTLKPVSKAAPVGISNASFVGLVAGGGRAAFATGFAALRFLDFRTMRWEFRIAYPGRPAAALWNFANKLVTLNQSSTAEMIVVDPTKRRLGAMRGLGGSLAAYAVAGDRIVAVIAPLDGIGAAKLAVIDDTGRVRMTQLPLIRAGTETLDNGSTFRFERPALAVRGNRAVVISPSGLVAEVSLDSLRVSMHALLQRSLAAARKNATGSERTALWIGTSTIALTGSDLHAENEMERSTPAGLSLVDTDDWSVRTIDSTASGIALGFWGWPLLAFGSNGVGAYDTAGTLGFRLFEGREVRPSLVAGFYAYFSDQNATHFTIVDTASGKVVKTVDTATPTFLAPSWPY